MANVIKVLLLIGILGYLFSCSPISNYESSLNKIEEQIEQGSYKNKIDDSITRIQAISDNAIYTGVVSTNALTSERKPHEQIVTRIHQLAKELRAMEDLDDNSDNRKAAKNLFQQLEGEVAALGKSLLKWRQKYARVAELIDNRAKNEKQTEQVRAQYDRVKPALFAKFDKALIDYPQQQQRINEFKADFTKLDKDLDQISAFFALPISSVSAQDYREHIELYDKVKIKDNLPVALVGDYANKIDELYKSYTKLLTEDKEQHGVQMAAVSWNDYYDYPDEYQRVFPYTIVTAADLAAIKNEIANYSVWDLNYIYQSALITRVTGGHSRSGWNGNTDKAELWIEDMNSEYTHVYTILEGTEKKVVEQSVSEQTYNKFKNAVGLSIYSKPYGMFEDEAIDTVHEFGMSKVGNDEYGEWRRDPSTGQDIWMWYAAYVIFDNLTDRKISRARYMAYSNRMNGFVPIKDRKAYKDSVSYGMSSYKSPLSQSYTPSRNNSLKGAGASFRNKGPGRGK